MDLCWPALSGRLTVLVVMAVGILGCTSAPPPSSSFSPPRPAAPPAPAPTPAPSLAVGNQNGGPNAVGPKVAATVKEQPAPEASRAQATQETKARVPEDATGGSRVLRRMVDVTPLTSATDSWAGLTKEGAAFMGAYTKLIITSRVADGAGPEAADGSVQTLGYEPRPWPLRALIGKEFNYILTAKLTVDKSPALTVPLLAIGHQSNAEGEVWVRDVQRERNDFPLFLVRTDGTGSAPHITVELKAANTFSSRAAAAGVSAVAQLAKFAGAEPGVITTLTKSSTEAAASQVDSALSRLFASSITERIGSDRDLRRWKGPGHSAVPPGLTISANLPHEDDLRKMDPVGTWTLSFSPPRPSIFSDWSVCAQADDGQPDHDGHRCSATLAEARTKVRDDVRDSDVLAYKLVRNAPSIGTIRVFLVQQEWFTAAIASFAQSRSGTDTMRPFCQRIVNEIVGLGLNDFDARLVLRAVHTTMPIALPDLLQEPYCADAIRSVQPTTAAAETAKTKPSVAAVQS